MTDEKPRRRPGPKPQYDRLRAYAQGAPRLETRVDPDVYAWIKSSPEGTRPYIERIVRRDMAETLGAREDTGDAEEQS